MDRRALLAVLALCAACKRKEPWQPKFDAPDPREAGTTAAILDAGPLGGMTAAARAAELAQARAWLADLQWCIEHHATQNPQQAGEGDASSKCEAVTAARAKTTDPEIAATLDTSLALCAFDIHLLTANEALDHLRNASSQASIRLMCEVSGKEIAKAKQARPGDPQVKKAEARRAGKCR